MRWAVAAVETRGVEGKGKDPRRVTGGGTGCPMVAEDLEVLVEVSVGVVGARYRARP
jgi:hypothetical protein